jgi:UDP-2,4-diacetamido-2,4,6-trideoxy-beta-L-altropyranose hydrolase
LVSYGKALVNPIIRIAFRTDASLQIGTGHVMRCLTLAESLREEGAQCHFICRLHQGNLIEQIAQKGFIVKILPVNATASGSSNTSRNEYTSWLGADWETDAAQSKGSVGNTIYDWLIVDHYALDEQWENAMRQSCRRLMVIDDLADRRHDCDLLLDQNLGRNEGHYRELVSENSTTLTGPKYALLRPEFAALRDYSLQRRTEPRLNRLLISMGGVDQANTTGQALEALKGCPLPDDLHITVVMGPNAPWLTQVKFLSDQMPQQTEVKVNVQNMAHLMAESDLAIGAAGSTSWERCCLGVPSIITVVAENQRESAIALERKGCVKLIDSNNITPNHLNSIFNSFIIGNDLMRMTQSSRSVVDGRGTNRVLQKLFES